MTPEIGGVYGVIDREPYTFRFPVQLDHEPLAVAVLHRRVTLREVPLVSCLRKSEQGIIRHHRGTMAEANELQYDQLEVRVVVNVSRLSFTRTMHW